MIQKKCESCYKIFKSFASRKRRFCSRKCANLNTPGLFMKGHSRTQGSKHGNWNGGIGHNSGGYIYISSPKHPNRDVRGYMLEHRLKMEKHIGRYLDKKEVVHHINGIKTDNRLSNLKLLASQSIHARLEEKYNKKFQANRFKKRPK